MRQQDAEQHRGGQNDCQRQEPFLAKMPPIQLQELLTETAYWRATAGAATTALTVPTPTTCAVIVTVAVTTAEPAPGRDAERT